jgi:hypothetical protein
MQSFTPWVASCCDMLEANAQCTNDHTLVTLVRITGTIGDSWESLHLSGQSAQQSRLLLLGLESQWQNIHRCIPPGIATSGETSLARLVLLARFVSLTESSTSPLSRCIW